MKAFTLALLLVASTVAASQAYGNDTYVNGYYRNNGTYVQPYYRTRSDGNLFNNYSTQGNMNPYTGNFGTVNPVPMPTYNNPYNSNPYSGNFGRRRSW